MTKDRWFYKTDDRNDILAIYRLNINDDIKKVTELVWLDNAWIVTDNLVQMITGGEFYLDEVTRETVQHFTPYVDTNEYKSE